MERNGAASWNAQGAPGGRTTGTSSGGAGSMQPPGEGTGNGVLLPATQFYPGQRGIAGEMNGERVGKRWGASSGRFHDAVDLLCHFLTCVCDRVALLSSRDQRLLFKRPQPWPDGLAVHLFVGVGFFRNLRLIHEF